jgi:long-chain acyl-CoA synthetase
MGEKVGAVVVAMPGTTPTAAGLRAWARELIADFKVPQYIVVRDEPLPRNAGGKVLKPTLRDSTAWGPELR